MASNLLSEQETMQEILNLEDALVEILASLLEFQEGVPNEMKEMRGEDVQMLLEEVFTMAREV